jgi:hypothetical protein
MQVRFGLEKNKVAETYANAEYDRDGRVPKVTPEEMCEIRKEVSRHGRRSLPRVPLYCAGYLAKQP